MAWRLFAIGSVTARALTARPVDQRHYL